MQVFLLGLGSLIHVVHVLEHTDHHIAVAVLVVIPGDELHKIVVQQDAGLFVKDAGQGSAIRSVDTTWSVV